MSRLFVKKDVTKAKKIPKFESIENQRCLMNDLYQKFQLESLDEWLIISKSKFNLSGGKTLLQNYYKDNFNQLLTNIYPNHSFAHDKMEEIQIRRKHRFLLETLGKKLQINNKEEWLTLPKNTIRSFPSLRNIIKKFYENDVILFILSIYPNYDWNFDEIFLKSKNYLNNIENQKKLMQKLAQKLEIKNIENFLIIKKQKISENGIGKALLGFYSNDLIKLLSTIYPDHPWDFREYKRKLNPKEFFTNNENEIYFIEQIYTENNFQSIDQLKELTKNKLILTGGKNLIEKYDGSINKLLSTIYPNFPWKFENLITKYKKYFNEIENQKEYLNKLFFKLKLKKLDDWLEISTNQISDQGFKILRSKYKNLFELLQIIYPNYPWTMDQYLKSKKLRSHRKFVIKFAKKFRIKTNEDWKKIKKIKFSRNGGRTILEYYENSFPKMLNNLFPNQFWNSFQYNPKEYFNNIIHQKEFLDNIYKENKLNHFGEWIFISIKKIIKKFGGKFLLRLYPNIFSLFSSIYPNYPWQFDDQFLIIFDRKNYFKSIENQRKFLFLLMEKLNFHSLDDFLSLQKFSFQNIGGKYLLRIYNNNMKILLSNIFPDHNWNFFHLKYQPNKENLISFEYHQKKLLNLIQKYKIRSKKDWYRIKECEKYFYSLKKIFPNEKFPKKLMKTRTKKANQRLLFSLSNEIYSNYFIIEDYKHPLICFKEMEGLIPVEFDIFIPSLYLAMEYQGAQHYDDIPSGFANMESYLHRDQLKMKLSIDHNVKLIIIPYWWDFSAQSLITTINSYSPPSSSSSSPSSI